ncbi:MAG: type II toxin-antitoxin system YafQ family toxin [Tyzzerella sp.]|nr:type II toxin-antitoxin system YafQ family toxin [Tyzzerella sp.]
MLIAFDTEIPSEDKICSASSFTSGSILAYKLAVFAIYNFSYDHPLTGKWIGYRECHIQPDWLLIYHINKDVLVLTLSRTGTHSDLFKK